MKNIKIYPLKNPIDVSVEIPGSLSYTIRALNIAAMTEGSVKIINPVKSDDSYAMITILKTLGIAIEEGENYFIVHGSITNIVDKEYDLNARISGRTARTVLSLLTVIPGIKTLRCDEGFKRRPVKDLVDGLKQLGAHIEYLEKEGYLPVKISSTKLRAGDIKMKGEISSQYISSLLMIAPLVNKTIIEIVGEQSSKPFIDVTIEIMKSFGIEVMNDNYKKYSIENNQKYKNPEIYIVEADAIAATYFWAIAALTKSKIKILHLSPNSKQGDIQFADILEHMGSNVTKNHNENWIAVEGTNTLNSIEIDMNSVPDSVLTLSVVAAFAKGITKIAGLNHLKVKESDRLESPKNELLKMKIDVKTTKDSLIIHGNKPESASIETYGDHRMAMAFAVAGTKIPDGIEIKNPDVIDKSFPEFWDTLEKIGIQVERIN